MYCRKQCPAAVPRLPPLSAQLAKAVRMGSVTTTASCPDLGGQGRVDATHASGASMTLCTHGGHLVSWKTAAGDEM